MRAAVRVCRAFAVAMAVAVSASCLAASAAYAAEAFVDANTEAAILAAQLLLTHGCDPEWCQDDDGLCKACAHPQTGGAEPSASDALAILRVAVGQGACARCVCDADGSGVIVASDALLTLERAVGQNVILACPAA